jgi:hypothetical protein
MSKRLVLLKRVVWCLTGAFFTAVLLGTFFYGGYASPLHAWLARAAIAFSAAVPWGLGLFAGDDLISRSIPPFV